MRRARTDRSRIATLVFCTALVVAAVIITWQWLEPAEHFAWIVGALTGVGAGATLAVALEPDEPREPAQPRRAIEGAGR